jgi:hypothetical protein
MRPGDDIVSDAQLMQYLHGELNDADRAWVDAQILATPAVAERLDLVRHRSSRLSILLRAADPAPVDVEASALSIRPTIDRNAIARSHWWQRTPPALRIAASIAILLGAVLLVEPARAWVLEQARAVAEVVGLVDSAPTDVAPQVDVARDADVRLSFPWSAATFDIAVGNAAGNITITAGSADEATAEMAGASGTSLMVVPTGIRIEGSGSADALYTLTLPSVVTTVRVIRAGGTAIYDLPADGGVLRVPVR